MTAPDEQAPAHDIAARVAVRHCRCRLDRLGGIEPGHRELPDWTGRWLSR